MAEVDWAPNPGRLAAGVTLVCSFLTLSCQGKKFSSPDHVGDCRGGTTCRDQSVLPQKTLAIQLKNLPLGREKGELDTHG